MTTATLLSPGRLGPLTTRSRLVRAATSETMGDERGAATDALVGLYERLSASGLGAMLTGHMYGHRRGQYIAGQTGICDEEHVAALRRVTGAVHRHGTPILAQLSHAGSQSRAPGNEPVAPSPIANALTGRTVRAAAQDEIEEAIDGYVQGARRAMEAGFDGVHLHGANGYLISEFSSPVTNRRTDRWGGSAEARDQFAVEVVRAVRAVVPADRALTLKLGMVDAVPGGLDLAESVPRAARLVAEGVDALEISSNVMTAITDSARTHVAVDPRRAAEDLLLHRLGRPEEPEAYFVPWARAVRSAVTVPIIGVGGMRRTHTMNALLAAGDIDFVAMARPLIREPDLATQIAQGRTGRVDCTSCNLCLLHEGHHSLRCWRTPRRRLVEHAVYRLRGKLR